MATYSDLDLENIAAAIAVDPQEVHPHAQQFEAAALWYRLDRRRPVRRSSFQKRKNAEQIAASARRLLKHLGIADPAAAEDGPGDIQILELLSYGEASSEDVVLRACLRLGRLVRLLDGIQAAAELERVAAGAVKAIDIPGFKVPKGHHGDDAVNDWIAAMMVIYCDITGCEPRTSVAAFGSPHEGVASGPLIRFLVAAARPAGMTADDSDGGELSEDALRSRVRTILATRSVEN
jgi:hypothetical protein